VSAIFTPFTSTSTWVDEDLLVLLELSVHGVPVEVDQVAQLLVKRGNREVEDAAWHYPESPVGEVVGVAPARRTAGVSVRSQQLHAYVLPREVIRGLVRDLPHELEALRVGDELSAEVRAHPFGPVLDMNTLSDLRHRTLPQSTSLVWATIGNTRAVSRLP
jgi:hypothetical protein